jgi:hypothetical protein
LEFHGEVDSSYDSSASALLARISHTGFRRCVFVDHDLVSWRG